MLVISGALAGLLAKVVTHPLDTIKANLQVQGAFQRQQGRAPPSPWRPRPRAGSRRRCACGPRGSPSGPSRPADLSECRSRARPARAPSTRQRHRGGVASAQQPGGDAAASRGSPPAQALRDAAADRAQREALARARAGAEQGGHLRGAEPVLRQGLACQAPRPGPR